MAVMMPALRKAREIAKRTICMTNLKTMWQATNMYAQDWNGRMSLEYPEDDNNHKHREWYSRLFNYAPNLDIYTCPAFNEREAKSIEDSYNVQLTRFTPKTGDAAGETVYVTYTGNEFVYTGRSHVTGKKHNYKIDEIASLAAQDHWIGLLLGDGIYQVNGWGNWSPMMEMIELEGNPLRGRANYRHDGKAVFLCGDGSVGYIDKAEVMALPRGGYRELTPSMLK
jgi:hypothetical protein